MKQTLSILMVSIALTACNTETTTTQPTEPNPVDETTNPSNETIIDTFELGTVENTFYLNDVSVMFDMYKHLTNSVAESFTDYEIKYAVSTNDDRVKVVDNVMVVQPTEKTNPGTLVVPVEITATLTKWNGEKEIIKANTTYRHTFTERPASNESGLYVYTAKLFDTIPVMADLSGYTAINTNADITSPVSDAYVIREYNVNDNDCQTIKNSQSFYYSNSLVMSAGKPVEMVNRCLFVGNTNVINDVIKTYFMTENLEMVVGQYNGFDTVSVDYYDFDEYIYYDIADEEYGAVKTTLPEQAYTVNSEIAANYFGEQDFLTTVFSYKVADIRDNKLYVFSPFSDDFETVSFSNEIEMVETQNTTDFVLIKENSFNDSVFWMVDRDLNKTQVAAYSNVEWVETSATNELMVAFDDMGRIAIDSINLSSNTETNVFNYYNNLTTIYGWFVDGPHNYLVAELNGTDSVIKIENNTFEKMIDAVATHEVRYLIDDSIVYIPDYDTLTIQGETSERNKRGVMTYTFNEISVSIVMTNTRGQEELVSFTENTSDTDPMFYSLSSNSVSNSTKPNGSNEYILAQLGNVETSINFVDKTSFYSGRLALANRLDAKVVFGEKTIDHNTNTGRTMVHSGFSYVFGEVRRTGVIGDESFSQTYNEYTDYNEYHNFQDDRNEWSVIQSYSSNTGVETIFTCEKYNAINASDIEKVKYSVVDDFKILNEMVYVMSNNYITEISVSDYLDSECN